MKCLLPSCSINKSVGFLLLARLVAPGYQPRIGQDDCDEVEWGLLKAERCYLDNHEFAILCYRLCAR